MRLANLNHAQATESMFVHSSLQGATCVHANFDMAMFTGDPEMWTSLQAADCSGALFNQARAEMRAAAFHAARTASALCDLSAQSHGMRSRRDIYAQAQFIFTDLSYGNFDSADMRDAVFEQVDLAASSSL